MRKGNQGSSRCRLALTYVVALLTTTFDAGRSELRVPDKKNRSLFGYVREGDINLGQLVGFTAGHECDEFHSTGVLYSKAVQYAVGQINRRTDLLPNVTLGFVQMDDCWDELAAIDAAMYLTGNGDGEQTSANKTTCLPLTWLSKDGSVYPRSFDVAGVVGPATSSMVVAVAQVLGTFKIPVMGLVSTVNSLSDKSAYPYVMRMVPPDLAAELAMLQIARYMGWTYLSMVHSASAYGDGAFNDIQLLLRTRAADFGICLAMSVRIPPEATEADYEHVVDQLTSDPAARVVLIYVEIPPNTDMPGLFNAVRKRVGNGWFMWLASDALNGISSEDYADVLEGALYVNSPGGQPIPEFAQFFESLPWSGADSLDTNPQKSCNVDDIWFQQFWQELTGCETTASECQLMTSLRDSGKRIDYIWSITSRAYDATNVFAQALHKTISQKCPDVFLAPQQDPFRVRDCVRGSGLLRNLLNTNTTGVMGHIEFDSNGNRIDNLYIIQFQRRYETVNGSSQIYFDEFEVGTVAGTSGLPSFNKSSLSWVPFKNVTAAALPLTASGDADRGVVQSVCSRPCRVDEYVVRLSVSCCWRCESCRQNEIVSANGTGCVVCPVFTWPAILDQNVRRNGSLQPVIGMTCLPITPTVLKPSDSLAGVLIALAVVCASATLSVVVIYVIKRDHRLIKATSRELSAIILSGCLLASATTITYVMWPTDNLCSFRNVAFHISTNLLYAPLLVKTQRIYRIFAAAKSSVRMPPFVSWQAQMIMTLAVVVIQVALSIISELLDQSKAALNQPASYVNYVELYCYKSIAWFLVQLAYNIAIMIVCAVLGFKARRLPENFNDSQFIFISVATTLFVWILFVPSYFTAYYAYLRSAIIGFCLVSNVSVTLVCQFVRIAYAVFFVPTDNIKFNMTAEGGTSNQVAPSTAPAPSSISVSVKPSKLTNLTHSSGHD